MEDFDKILEYITEPKRLYKLEKYGAIKIRVSPKLEDDIASNFARSKLTQLTIPLRKQTITSEGAPEGMLFVDLMYVSDDNASKFYDEIRYQHSKNFNAIEEFEETFRSRRGYQVIYANEFDHGITTPIN